MDIKPWKETDPKPLKILSKTKPQEHFPVAFNEPASALNVVDRMIRLIFPHLRRLIIILLKKESEVEEGQGYNTLKLTRF